MTEDSGFSVSFPGGRVGAAGTSDDPARMSLVLGGPYDEAGSVDLLLRDGALSLDVGDGEPNVQVRLDAATLVGLEDWQDGEYEAGEEVQEITIKTDKRTVTKSLRGADAVGSAEPVADD